MNQNYTVPIFFHLAWNRLIAANISGITSQKWEVNDSGDKVSCCSHPGLLSNDVAPKGRQRLNVRLRKLANHASLLLFSFLANNQSAPHQTNRNHKHHKSNYFRHLFLKYFKHVRYGGKKSSIIITHHF